MEARKHTPLGIGRWVYLGLGETQPTQLMLPNTSWPREGSTNSSVAS